MDRRDLGESGESRANRGESWTGTSLAVESRVDRTRIGGSADRGLRRIGDRHPSGGGSGTGADRGQASAGHGSDTDRTRIGDRHPLPPSRVDRDGWIGDRHPLRPSRAEGIKGGGGRERGSWTRGSSTGSLPRRDRWGGIPLTRLKACFAEGAGKPGSRSRGGSRRAIRPVEPRHGIRVELRMRLIQSPRPGGA